MTDITCYEKMEIKYFVISGQEAATLAPVISSIVFLTIFLFAGVSSSSIRKRTWTIVRFNLKRNTSVSFTLKRNTTGSNMISRWSLAATLMLSTLVTLQADNVCDSCRCNDNAGTSPKIVTVDCSNLRLTAGFVDKNSWPTGEADSVMDVSFEHNGMVRVHALPEVHILKVSYAHNRISAVDDGAFFGPSATLEEVDLSSNALTFDSLKPHAFRGSFDPKTYQPLPKLRVLRLARNSLHSLHPDLFEHLPELEELYLDFNPMPVLDTLTVQAIASVIKLKVLSLSNMNLVTLPDTLLHTPRFLEVLVISGNDMTEIPSTVAQAKELRKLVLDGNLIRRLHNESFPFLTKLTYLSISHMPELVAIEDGALSGLVALEELHCEQNPKLVDIETYALDSELNGYARKPLRILKLNNNHLSYLHRHLVPRWESLETISLYGNPWSCDCVNQWIITDLVPILDKIDPSMTSRLMCYEPEEMAGKTFRDIEFHSPHMRCLDKYGNHPENDGPMLIGVLIGALIAIPILLSIYMLYKKRGYFFGACLSGGGTASSGRYHSPGAGDFSRAFYKRADAAGDI